MSVLEDARAALAQGELAEEMGWRVTWPEVMSLHKVIHALIEEIESRDEYAAIFDAPQGAWRNPLGALRLTLAGDPEKVDVPRAQHECEQLVKVLNGVKD